MLLSENGEYYSTSEEEGEALADFGRFGDVHEKGKGRRRMKMLIVTPRLVLSLCVHRRC